MKILTVGELKKALDGVPDNLKVEISSDSGVDQGMGDIIVENAYRVRYELPEGRVFEDTGDSVVDYFAIYANDYLEGEIG